MITTLTILPRYMMCEIPKAYLRSLGGQALVLILQPFHAIICLNGFAFHYRILGSLMMNL